MLLLGPLGRLEEASCVPESTLSHNKNQKPLQTIGVLRFLKPSCGRFGAVLGRLAPLLASAWGPLGTLLRPLGRLNKHLVFKRPLFPHKH